MKKIIFGVALVISVGLASRLAHANRMVCGPAGTFYVGQGSSWYQCSSAAASFGARNGYLPSQLGFVSLDGTGACYASFNACGGAQP